MKTILKNGKIFIEKGIFQEAILIENNFIKKIGTNREILREDADRIIDLEGKTVLPGINDSHLHLSFMGEAMNNCDLKGADSIDHIIAIGKKFIKDNPHIKALKGSGWNEDYFISGDIRPLDKDDLDKISREIPIVFDRVCSHMSSSNSKAIELLDIDENTNIDGGIIEVDSQGNLKGIFKEYAVQLIQSVIPEKEDSQVEREILSAMDYCISLGITSVGSCDIMNNDSEQIFRVIHKIYREKKTKLRYSHQFNFQNIEAFREYLDTEFKNESYDERFLSKGSLKLFKDGSLGARTALLKDVYNDDPSTSGVDSHKDSDLEQLISLANENNIQVLAHAIGDGAVDSLIDVYKSANGSRGNKLRHSIIHCQITSRDQLKRISEEKLSVFLQPIFLDYDIQIVEKRVGKKLASTSYAFNSLYSSDAKVSFSTDAPVEDANPFPNMYCAVNRLRLDESPAGGFFPEEKMDVESVVDAYTAGSAYNEFKENFKGKLKEDYVADLIVIDRDIFTVDPLEIKSIKVEKTMIDGEFVYER